MSLIATQVMKFLNHAAVLFALWTGAYCQGKEGSELKLENLASLHFCMHM